MLRPLLKRWRARNDKGKMNVLQILPSLDVGGVETGTIDLAKYLVLRGHKAITVSKGGRLVRELDAIGARHYNLPVGKKSLLNT